MMQLDFKNLLPSSWHGHSVIATCLVFALGNFFVVPLTSEQPNFVQLVVGCLLLGATVGQVGLVAAWGVLAPLPSFVRLSSSVAIGGLLVAAYSLGAGAAYAAHSDVPTEVEVGFFTGVVLLIPHAVVAAQIPISLCRLIFGWQVCHVRQYHKLGRPTQFSLAYLMGATAVVGILLATVEQALRLLRVPVNHPWLLLGIYLLIISLLSAGTILPAVYAIQRFRSARNGFLGMLVYAFGAYSIVILCVFSQSSPPDSVIPKLLAAPACLFLGLVLSLTLPLWALRKQGYRLVTGNPSPEQETKFFEDDNEPPK